MVKLFKQSYSEVVDHKTGKLEGNLLIPIGLVSATHSDFKFNENTINELNLRLIREGENLNADYVFGVEYRGLNHNPDNNHPNFTIGYGDAYKIKEGKGIKGISEPALEVKSKSV